MEKEILQITVLKGPKNGEILVCKPESRLHIGRVMKGNDFALRDPGISQKHLCFKFDPEASRWVVSDLDSSNGTILNGSKIQPLVPVPISDHDVISIGEKSQLGVRIVHGVSLEENKENGDANVRRVNPRRGLARSNARSGGSAKEVVKEVESSVVVPVTGGRNNVEVNSIRVLAEEENMEKIDETGGVQPRRNPRRGNSSKALKELDMNCAVDGGIQAKGVQKKRKERGKGKEVGIINDGSQNRKEELLLETEDCDSDSVILSNEGTGFKAITRFNSSMVTGEDKGEEDVGVKEGLEVNHKEVGDDIETMTLGQWFDSMFIFLPKAIHDETEELIKILKEKSKKYDELIEAGGNV
ncbi:FHA domain-containing protein [Rhynchospora pubera]|uniref:FHA domain-containing protein n=1 Tax=Rhynchospora pubera TaxID=906938 RepID=A0AAV8DFA5_9POAL|nr:FHA domain-containing protein [Rhynchospora pubera]